jgi:hypothetical protein
MGEMMMQELSTIENRIIKAIRWLILAFFALLPGILLLNGI